MPEGRVIIENLFLLSDANCNRYSFSRRYSITSLDFASFDEAKTNLNRRSTNIFRTSGSITSQITIDSFNHSSAANRRRSLFLNKSTGIDALDLAKKNAKFPPRYKYRNSMTNTGPAISPVLSDTKCRSSFKPNHLITSLDFCCLDESEELDPKGVSSFCEDYLMSSLDDFDCLD